MEKRRRFDGQGPGPNPLELDFEPHRERFLGDSLTPRERGRSDEMFEEERKVEDLQEKFVS